MDGLEPLLGSWLFTMRHVQVADPVQGRQHFRPVLGGAFVRLDWTYQHPDFPDAMALLGGGSMHYFDVRGVARLFRLQVSAEGWSTFRLDQDFGQRMSVVFDGPDRMSGLGENSYDDGASWQRDFTIGFRRESIT